MYMEKNPAIFGIVILILLIIGGLGWYVWTAPSGEAPALDATSQAAPSAVESAVRSYVASRLSLASPGEVTVVSSVAKDWSDSCLGLGGIAESCAAVITSGYEIVVIARGGEYHLRTNTDGSVIRGTGALDVTAPFQDKG